VLDLNDYLRVSEKSRQYLLWTVDKLNVDSPDLVIDEHERLSITNPKTAGLFSAVIRASDGYISAERKIFIKVSHLIIEPVFCNSAGLITTNDEAVTEFSLYEKVIPHDMPRSRIVFEILQPLPENILEARVLPDGRVWLRRQKLQLNSFFQLQVMVKYIEPTPEPSNTPSRTPEIMPTMTFSPVAAPGNKLTPVAQPAVQSRDHSPYRMPAITPIAVSMPTPTLTPIPDLLILSKVKRISFKLSRVERTGSSPMDLVSADLNRDGITDFVTADLDNDAATLLLSIPDDQYHKISLDAGGEGCVETCVRDLDMDGVDDLALLTGFDSHIRIYWGIGEGAMVDYSDIDLPFQVSLPLEQGHAAKYQYMAVGHFLDCEELSLVCIGYEEIGVMAISKDKSIEMRNILSIQGNPVHVIAVDFDADGVDELAYTSVNPNMITVCSIKGNIPRKIMAKTMDTSNSGNIPLCMIKGRFVDGDASCIAVYSFFRELFIGYGDVDNKIRWNHYSTPNFIMRDMTCGDYDGDGQWEFILAGQDIESEKPSLLMVCRSGAGRYDDAVVNQVSDNYSLNQDFSISTVNLNNDSLDDLVLLDNVKNQLMFFINQSLQSPDLNESIQVQLPRTPSTKPER